MPKNEGGFYRLLLPLPVLVDTKEEWKRALSFVIALSREYQRMTVLRTDPARSHSFTSA
jgi:hypothetical protein